MGKSAAQKVYKFAWNRRKRLERQGIIPEYSCLDPNYPDAIVEELELASLNWKAPAAAPEPVPEPIEATELEEELFRDCADYTLDTLPPITRIGRKIDISIEMLAEILGGEVSQNGQEVYAPGPGHRDIDRSMSVRLEEGNQDGFIVHSWGCSSWEECKTYVTELLSGVPTSFFQCEPSDAAKEKRETLKKEAIAKATQKWCFTSNRIGDAAHAYFASRNLTLPQDLIGRVVRYQWKGRWYHPKGKIPVPDRLPYDEAVEILTFAVHDVFTDGFGSGRAIQEVRMPHIGTKPNRKIHGASLNAAIKLTAHEDVLAAGELAISEGFESALAAMAIGYRNVWACINAANVAAFPVIDGINTLTILGEHCDANEEARLECAERWLMAGRKVVIDMPDHGKDFNDELMEGRTNG
jgi:putative DNA primase/helicase